MATVVAATTALALASAAPALADAHFTDVEKNLTTCEDAGLGGTLLIGDEGDQKTSIDGLSGEVSADGTKLNVTVDTDKWEITGTVVKGGPNSRIYPGAPVADMMAPHNPGDQIPQISHWYVCGSPKTPETSPPPTTEPPETTPPTTEPPTEEPTTPAVDDDKETPKPVPTSVPAGYGEADNGSASTIGLLAFVTALAVGGAALVTRRFLKDN